MLRPKRHKTDEPSESGGKPKKFLKDEDEQVAKWH